MHSQRERPVSRDDFTVGIICPLPTEYNVAKTMLDDIYEDNGCYYGKSAGDLNEYVTGRLGNHNVVLATMPGMSMVSASAVAIHLRNSFNAIRFGLLVGVCGGVPTTADGTEIRLGDVVISHSVTQIDFERQCSNNSTRKHVESTLERPNSDARAFMAYLSTIRDRQSLQDRIYYHITHIGTADSLRRGAYPGAEHHRLCSPGYQHRHRRKPNPHNFCICYDLPHQYGNACEAALQSTCDDLGCDSSLSLPRKGIQTAKVQSEAVASRSSPADLLEMRKPQIHFGRTASINQAVRSAAFRDQLAIENDVICFEMESAGIWDHFPVVLIKGVCDYADGHNNQRWQLYAARTAAACVRELLQGYRSVSLNMDQSTIETFDRYVDYGSVVPHTLTKAPFSIPFHRDANFVVCKSILDQIHEHCSVSGSRVALTGLGGVGKSQLAIEYAYRMRERSPMTSIFWIHASSVARFEQSFREIADEVDIRERNESDANIFQLCYDWLRHHSRGHWVLILDGLDEVTLLETQDKQKYTESSRPFLSYIPRSQNGSILITTRSKGIASRLVESQQDIFQIKPMDEVSALMLLQKKLGPPREGDDPEAAIKLVRVLGYMPLAIVQAAAFISQKSPRCSVKQYLQNFVRNDTCKTTLLNYDSGNLRRNREARNSIIATWHISFDYIHRVRPTAADLLSLMCFYDQQVIPRTLLQHGSPIGFGSALQRKSSSTSYSARGINCKNILVWSSEEEFEDAIDMLQSYSFISTGLGGNHFEMHALVQLAMRNWLEEHNTIEKWKQQAVSRLCVMFPSDGSKNWLECQMLFPHVRSVVLQPPGEFEGSRDWASLLYRAAEYAIERGDIDDAVTMSAMSVETRKRILGNEHMETLASMRLLGLAYSLGGQWTQAEDLQAKILEISNVTLGPEHPFTCTGMKNLASTYRNQGRWSEAATLIGRAVKILHQVLGSENPYTLTSRDSLAATYWIQGRYEEAEKLNVRVLETMKRVLGPEHPDTLSSINNLALTYRSQGRYQEAEELNTQALEISRKVMGQEHPDTLASMSNLALIFRHQGRCREAEELTLKVIDMSIKVLGVEHPSTLTRMSDLAMLSAFQGRWEEAELLEISVMEVRKRVLGPEHPDTLSTLHNLAFVFKKTGRTREAIDCIKECLQLRELVLGPNHPLTRSSAKSLKEWRDEA